MATTDAFVRQLPGIIKTEGNLAENTFTVTFDPVQVNKEEIIQTIEDLGYTVSGEFTLPGE